MAHVNASFLRMRGAAIVALGDLIIDDFKHMSPEATDLDALIDFLKVVDVILQVAHAWTKNTEAEMVDEMPSQKVSDVLLKTEKFIDVVLRNGKLLSNWSMTFTHVDLYLVHVQLHNLPGLVLRVGSGFVNVENYTLLHSTADGHEALKDNTTLNSTATLENGAAIIAVVVLDVPQTEVKSETETGSAVMIESPVLSLSSAAGPYTINLQHSFTIPASCSPELTNVTVSLAYQRK
ncbi:hypothetical protein ElyMa_001014000 [Elysia marginata]|uniref:Uncharacterized protein n=1 Tax=Elysia marginata TaxID=1093978 RepID=A0AAV4HJC4_9GAST|nr:hypothetical protein ElyMa_001014000 [Elysia marginata]